MRRAVQLVSFHFFFDWGNQRGGMKPKIYTSKYVHSKHICRTTKLLWEKRTMDESRVPQKKYTESTAVVGDRLTEQLNRSRMWMVAFALRGVTFFRQKKEGLRHLSILAAAQQATPLSQKRLHSKTSQTKTSRALPPRPACSFLSLPIRPIFPFPPS